MLPVNASTAQSGPVQLTGRVVDDSGAPLAGATVTVAEFDTDKPGLASCETAADGSFQARGEWSSAQVLVRAMHADCWNSVRKTVPRGGAEVELRLERCSSIRGVFALRNHDQLPDLRLLVVNQDTLVRMQADLAFETEGPAIAERVKEPFRCAPDGSFSIRSLRPGRYELEVRGGAGMGVLAHVSELRVGVGQEWSGPECNPLLLDPDALLRLELALDRAPVLQPRNTLRVFFYPAPEGAAPKPVLLPGMYIVLDRTKLTSEAKQIVFEHPQDLASLRREAGEPDAPAADVDASGHATLALPGAGRYQVLWCLEYPDGPDGFWHFVPITSSEPQFVEVQRGIPVARLDFELDASQLEQLAQKR
jgi:hypothetical protein